MLREWDENREVDWHLAEHPDHAPFLDFITQLNRLYCQSPALWALDHSYEGFKWVEHLSPNPCVFGYTRTGGGSRIVALFNFSDVDAPVTVDWHGQLLLRTDRDTWDAQTEQDIPHQLPPYCGMLFQMKD